MLVGYEHMKNATMFTLDEHFLELNSIVDELRSQHRAAILELVCLFIVLHFINIQL